MSRKRAYSPSSPSPVDMLSEIFRSAPIEDRESIFVAAFSVSLSHKALQALPDFKSATHRIAAWRKPLRQNSLVSGSLPLYDTGCDDDGEMYAGKRLQNVLENMHVEGSVIVARWYGGIMLGPVRFTHIESCAKEAVRKWETASVKARDTEAQKRRKMEEDAFRAELEESLRERDKSIFVLRRLLAEKSSEIEKSGTTAETTPVTPKTLDYSSLSTQALRRLDKARDATIAFILKEIDKIEEQQDSLETVHGAGSSVGCSLPPNTDDSTLS
ncbi:ribosomal protein S5 domain 2-like protein [Lepidopterella palustris CBS 459.81]|uniref:Ribosomal protein S5 domain 2-like protein n=1 Tax=Lepidopterella palustris CBS 459.81 TaxID=1314670 RepID=A0A8E2JJB1_9PEZI|nr:ribosomal protein S5 domain 2-like protein [Lepidopterella palustris CBS 459.81]